jgi:DNA-binding SARP family transcriptional activator/Tfp pilus assembly protein PilF
MQERVSPLALDDAALLSREPLEPPRRDGTSPIARIHVLGAMRASTYRHADILPRGRKARAILGVLCLSEEDRVSRARLGAMLWDRVPDFQARASFRQAFRELTVAFGGMADELLTADRDTIGLDKSKCWIDAVALLSDEPGPEKNSRSQLALLCKGELLQDLSGITAAFDQWLLSERSRFTENLRVLLEGELEEAKSASTKPSEREMIARRLLEFDPTHEGARRILMRALADRNERVQALNEYKRCREALKLALDVEPSPETRALYEAIRMFAGRDEREPQPSEPITKKKQRSTEEVPSKRTHRRVGVLPFSAIAPSVDNTLAFSVAQEIAAALSCFRWFDVVAPMGLMRAPAPSFMSDAELRRHDLDYVVDGSVSCSGGSYRISVQLLDLTQDATPVWSNKFDVPVDRFDLLEERAIAPIVAQIDPVILYIEGKPSRRNEDDALGCVMRAIPLLYTMEKRKYEEAGRLIDTALRLDPNNAMVLAWAAYWRVYYIGQGWTNDTDGATKIALDYSYRATQLDPQNAEALAIYGHILAFLHKDVSMALHYFERALQLNRNLPFIWALSALSYCYMGDPDRALKQLKRVQELTASLPYFWLFENPISIAYLMKGMYQEAAEVAGRVVENTPAYGNGYKPLIAALGHLGRRDDAKKHVKKLLAIEPNFTVKKFGAVYPFKKDEDRLHYMEGLRRAGVPEG